MGEAQGRGEGKKNQFRTQNGPVHEFIWAAHEATLEEKNGQRFLI